MSGYGTPQGPPPGAPRSSRSGPALPVLDLVGLGLAVLAFIFAFLPWAGPKTTDISAKGWELPLPTAATVLLLTAAVLAVAPLLTGALGGTAPAAPPTGRRSSPVPALLACVAALLFLVDAIIGGTVLGTHLERKIGVWLGLIVGLAAAAVMVMSWLQAGRPRRPAAAPAGPAGGQWGGQQQPGAWGQQQPYGQQQPGYPGAAPQQPERQAPPAPPAPAQPSYGQGSYGQQHTPYGQGAPTGNQPAQGGYTQDYPPAGGYPSTGQGYPSQGQPGQGGYPQS